MQSKAKKFISDMQKDYQIYLFLLPSLVYFLIFCYVPMVGIQIAFKDYKPIQGIWGSAFVGWKHFVRFFSSYQAGSIIRNTLFISLYQLIASFPIPILLALLMNQLRSQRMKKALQTVTYAPHFVSVPAVVGMIAVMLSPSSGGVFYQALDALCGGKAGVPMGNSDWFSTIYVLSGIWQHAGWDAIIYIAALSAVDPALYEAAEIDGAGKMKKILYIDIPSLLPTAVIMLILNSGKMMSIGFEKVLLMQNSMNLEASEIISTYVYKQGLINREYSYSTAINLFNSAINFILITLVNFAAGKMADTRIW